MIINSNNKDKSLNDYLNYYETTLQKYDNGEVASKEISMIFEIVRLGLGDIIRHLENGKIIGRIKEKYLKDFTNVLENPLFKKNTDPIQCSELKNLIEIIKTIPLCPSASEKRAELSFYYYSDKLRKAFIILNQEWNENDDGTLDNTENGDIQIFSNATEMVKLLKSCGFEIVYVRSINQFNLSNCNNSMDVLVYYTGFSKINENNEISIRFGNRNHTLNDIVKLFSTKEGEMLLTYSKKLKQLYREEQSLIPIKDEELLTVYPNLFDSLSIKKIFIFDFINQQDSDNDNPVLNLFNSKKPNFPISKNNIYLYSNIPEPISNIFKNEKTTFLTSALINCIENDKLNEKGRNISSISKVIQYDIINKLNLIKPKHTFEIEFETIFKEIENNKNFKVDHVKLLEIQKETKKLFGTNTTELVFGKLLLNNLKIIYGDASTSDFLILDK